MFDSRWLEEITPDLERIGPMREDQITLIGQCVAHIDRQIPNGSPLWNACRHSNACWRRAGDGRPKPMSARIPFIGPEYCDQRIAVVAINSRDSGHAGDEVRATADVMKSLTAGNREYGSHSYFHYRVASVVHAVIAAGNGSQIDEKPEPQTAAQ